MAEQIDLNNNNDDNNSDDNDNDNSPIQQRTFFEGVIDYVTTPIRNQQRQPIQQLPIQPIQNQQLFPEPDPIEEINEDGDVLDLEPEEPTMPTTTYSLGGMSLEFDSEEPTQNTDYDVGVVISKANRPTQGSNDETKLIERLCKNQYPKYKKAETSMQSVERLFQSRGIMATINGTQTLLDKYDMIETFTIVLPMDPTLKKVALTSINGVPTTFNLLVDSCKVTKEQVALSCA
jgi:hypothetical protein